jgi:hypothetical protein
VYAKAGDLIFSNQLGVKIALDGVPDDEYYAWLDQMKASVGEQVPGAEIAEKADARVSPSVHTAIYYDTADFRLLPTGALLRATSGTMSNAYCTFKAPADYQHIRRDQRYVFAGQDKAVLQRAPDSAEAVAVVKCLLARTDIEHPGMLVRDAYGIAPQSLEPAIRLDDYRFTFFVWLDGKDALRCSLDRFEVSDLRLARGRERLAEVELSIYPRVDPAVAKDRRVRAVMDTLADSLCETLGVRIIDLIKYQRSARALGIS